MSNLTAKQLLPRLRHLVLAGQNSDGELEWIGTIEQWKLAETEEMCIGIANEYENSN